MRSYLQKLEIFRHREAYSVGLRLPQSDKPVWIDFRRIKDHEREPVKGAIKLLTGDKITPTDEETDHIMDLMTAVMDEGYRPPVNIPTPEE